MVRRLRGLSTAPPPFPPFRDGAFRSRLHDPAVAAWLGIALGVTFTVCFVTGLLSHVAQHPPRWFAWPSRPAGLYRVTQGVHVVTGIASIPLLGAKLFAVYPRLWAWPPVSSVAKAVERASVAVLVAGSLFLLISGLQNIAGWYPWGFFFPPAHYWVAWATIGALVAHIGAKAHIVRAAVRHREPAPERPAAPGLSRRGLMGAAAAATGVVALTVAGQTLRPLERVALLAPRSPSVGPAGFPVNRTAIQAGVGSAVRDPAWRLVVGGRVRQPMSLTLHDVVAMDQHDVELPIACVEGWSASVRWRGVRLADLLALAGAPEGASVRIESVERFGLYRAATLDAVRSHDPATLLALHANGGPLTLDHGYPVRLIAPNNPGVLQTKWVAAVVVL